LPRYIIGSVNNKGDVMLRMEENNFGIEYCVWLRSGGEYSICEKRQWGQTASFYEEIENSDSEEAMDMFDKLVAGKDFYNAKFVMCRICGSRMSNLVSSHLEKKHGMSLLEYQRKFPGAKIISDTFHDNMSSSSITRVNQWIGRKHSTEAKNKMRDCKIGTTRSDEAKNKQSESMKLKWQEEEYRKRASEGISISKKESWKDPEFVKKMMKSWMVKPNFCETRLNELLGSDFEYVGDGQVSMEGFVPDFINCNGKKIVVEFNGCYWHACEKCGYGDVVLPNGMTGNKIRERDAKKIETYKKYGYKTYVIWEHEDLQTAIESIE